MNDPRLKKHIGLARDAGTKAMAKDFFAQTPGAGGPAEGEMMGGEMGEAPEGAPHEAAELEQLTPEQLEELLALLAAQQGESPEGA